MINIDDYQTESDLHRKYRGEIQHALIYPALGLSGEVGEFHEKIKKIFRDKDGEITEADRHELKLELGDVMWYVAVCAQVLGLRLSEVLDANVKKLEDRRRRGQTSGSGDHR